MSGMAKGYGQGPFVPVSGQLYFYGWGLRVGDLAQLVERSPLEPVHPVMWVRTPHQPQTFLRQYWLDQLC